MEFIGKLIAVFILASSFAVGTVYVLENGLNKSEENESITVSSPISDALINMYRDKFRDDYHKMQKAEGDEKLEKDQDKYQPMWKFEYEKNN